MHFIAVIMGSANTSGLMNNEYLWNYNPVGIKSTRQSNIANSLQIHQISYFTQTTEMVWSAHILIQ